MVRHTIPRSILDLISICHEEETLVAEALDDSWIDIHGDGGIMKKIIQEGIGEVVKPQDYVSGLLFPFFQD